MNDIDIPALIERLKYDRTHLRVVMQRLDEAVSADLWAIAGDVDKAITALDQLRWRRVEDELPSYGQNVIVWDSLGDGAQMDYLKTGDFFTSERGEDSARVTHWLPLPTPPQESS